MLLAAHPSTTPMCGWVYPVSSCQIEMTVCATVHQQKRGAVLRLQHMAEKLKSTPKN